MERLILHLIGQYEDVSRGGGVGATMLGHWINTTRQGANYHLRKLHKDKLITRKNIGTRGDIPVYRYVLSDKAREFYEDGEFKNAYYEYVYTSELGEKFDQLSMNLIGEK